MFDLKDKTKYKHLGNKTIKEYLTSEAKCLSIYCKQEQDRVDECYALMLQNGFESKNIIKTTPDSEPLTSCSHYSLLSPIKKIKFHIAIFWYKITGWYGLVVKENDINTEFVEDIVSSFRWSLKQEIKNLKK